VKGGSIRSCFELLRAMLAMLEAGENMVALGRQLCCAVGHGICIACFFFSAMVQTRIRVVSFGTDTALVGRPFTQLGKRCSDPKIVWLLLSAAGADPLVCHAHCTRYLMPLTLLTVCHTHCTWYATHTAHASADPLD